jgi:hypothetical protein
VNASCVRPIARIQHATGPAWSAQAHSVDVTQDASPDAPDQALPRIEDDARVTFG